MKSIRVSCVFLVGFLLSTTLWSQQNGSVGIGIEDPNPNAILHLVSPESNQGLLIPTVTTNQRTATSFTSELSVAENGLLVFDVTEKAFYFWQDTQWQTLSSGNQSLQYDPNTKELKLSGGSTINLTGLVSNNWNDLEGVPTSFLDGIDEVNDADADPLNEIQDLSLNGNLLSITNNDDASVIDLDVLSGSDNQDLIFTNGKLSLSNDPDGSIIDFSGYDSNVSDDFDGQFTSLSGVPASLADGDQVDDADADPLNEIQSLELNGEVLTLSGDASGTRLDMSGWDNDASDDFDGQFTSLTGVPADLADGDQVDDADADPLNEIQSLELNGEVLTLSGDVSGTSLNFSGWDNDASDDFDGQFTSLTGVPADLADGDQVDDADADPLNEIQSLELNGEVLTLSGDVSGTSLNFSGWDNDASDDFDGQFTSLTGVPADLADGDQVDDADASATNELISLVSIQAGNTLRIVESGINHDVDLTSLVNDSDSNPTNELQNLTYTSASKRLTLTHPSGDQIWDLSELDNATPWIEENNNTNINYLGNYGVANNMISRPNPIHLKEADLIGTTGRITSAMINYHKILPVIPGDGTILRNIEKGINGQELILMVIGPGTLNIDGLNGNIYLSANAHALTQGSTIHLSYFIDQSSGTFFDGWMEVSVSKSSR